MLNSWESLLAILLSCYLDNKPTASTAFTDKINYGICSSRTKLLFAFKLPRSTQTRTPVTANILHTGRTWFRRKNNFLVFSPSTKARLANDWPYSIFENGCFITQASEQRPVIIFRVYHTLCVHQSTEMHFKNMICLGGFIALWYITSWRDQNMILWRKTEYLTTPPTPENNTSRGKKFPLALAANS